MEPRAIGREVLSCALFVSHRILCVFVPHSTVVIIRNHILRSLDCSFLLLCKLSKLMGLISSMARMLFRRIPSEFEIELSGPCSVAISVFCGCIETV